MCYHSTIFLDTIKYSDDLCDNAFPFLEGKKYLQGEAHYHSKACRQMKHLAR